jgi:PAS domain S-box-containing protein
MSVAEPHVQSILLGDAIEHAPTAVLVADERGDYVAVNTYACRMLGYERDELLSLNVTDVACYEGAADEFEELASRRSHGGTASLRCKDGGDVSFLYQAGETKIAGMTYYVAVGWPAE